MSKAPQVYLDCNATAPVLPAALDAAREAMTHTGNPSSVHAAGRRARSLLERSREQVAMLAGADASEVVFTSGGTEANALALLGVAAAGVVKRLIVSAIEHDSVLETAKLATQRHGLALDVVPVLPTGVIDLDALEGVLRANSPPSLVSVMAANNETGVLQPIDEAARLAHAHGTLFHTDATQIAGRLPFTARNFDLTTLSAHKLGGIMGAGALIVRNDLKFAPLWAGGRQEAARRSGTEALPAIAAFGAAAAGAADRIELAETHAQWRNRMEARLRAAVPGIKIFGAESLRLPQTSCSGLPGTLAETQVIALDLAGFAVSAGSACSSGKVRKSHVLTAMGANEAEARCAIRVSFGQGAREADLNRFADVWAAQLLHSLRTRAPLEIAGAA